MKKIVGALIMGLVVTAFAACDDDDSSATNGGVDASTGSDSSTPASDAGAGTDSAMVNTDSGGPTDDATSGQDSGGECNALTNTASDVQITDDTGAIPTGTGGTIADGTYHLTEVRAYQGSPLKGIVFKQSAVISGGGKHAEIVANDSDKPEFHESDTLAPSGAAITVTQTCTTEQNATPIPYDSFKVEGNALTLFCSAYKFSVTYSMQ